MCLFSSNDYLSLCALFVAIWCNKIYQINKQQIKELLWMKCIFLNEICFLQMESFKWSKRSINHGENKRRINNHVCIVLITTTCVVHTCSSSFANLMILEIFHIKRLTSSFNYCNHWFAGSWIKPWGFFSLYIFHWSIPYVII